MTQYFHSLMYSQKKKKEPTTKTLIQKDMCNPMFIAALFTIAKIQKQPKCPPTNELIKKIWYTYNEILLSH